MDLEWIAIASFVISLVSGPIVLAAVMQLVTNTSALDSKLDKMNEVLMQLRQRAH
jgi:hypothetical protein